MRSTKWTSRAPRLHATHQKWTSYCVCHTVRAPGALHGTKMAPGGAQDVTHGPKMAPKCAQVGCTRAQDCPKGIKTDPGWPREAPSWLQDGPKRVQDGHKMAPDAEIAPQVGSKMAPRGPKMAHMSPNGKHKSHQEIRHRWSQEATRCCLMASRPMDIVSTSNSICGDKRGSGANDRKSMCCTWRIHQEL